MKIHMRIVNWRMKLLLKYSWKIIIKMVRNKMKKGIMIKVRVW